MSYEHLRETYPAVISAEQLYRICRISKRKSSWLLQNGVIPCSDSGKRTRRFRIRLDDVIDFLERRDAGELGGAIPCGAFSSGSAHRPQPVMDSEALCTFILAAWSDAPDMLRTKEASALCGYVPTTINQWVKRGLVQAVRCYGQNYISKQSLAEYLSSRAGQLIAVKSAAYVELLKGTREGK